MLYMLNATYTYAAIGEVNVDQAHRGYGVAVDGSGGSTGEGYKSVNPLFMKYTPGSKGEFTGQQGYGYRYCM